MNKTKKVVLNVRVSQQIADAVHVLAKSEERTLTEMVAIIITNYCRINGIRIGSAPEKGTSSAIKLFLGEMK